MKTEHPLGRVAFARQLRRAPTLFEKKLWDILRGHKQSEFHFRRQHPIGPYIADFACISAKLIVELDGNSHDDRLNYDAKRDFDLQQMGWRVLRFPNAYARDRPDDLWRSIEIELNKGEEAAESNSEE
jgi:primosomal protein N' (replication factor Y)